MDNLKDTIDRFVDSYAGRDQRADFSEWLTKRLEEELPDMPSGDGEKLSGEIIEGVKAYDQTLGDLSTAIESGQSKEEWLADRTVEACSGMSDDSAGKSLSRICNDLDASNAALMDEIEGTSEHSATVDATEITEWNEYSIKSKALDIGKQAVMSGLSGAAGVIKRNIERGEAVDVNEAISKALESGLDSAKGEVKAVVAGAMQVAAQKGLAKVLPVDTPVETVCDLAGAVVESAVALKDAAMGKITLTESLEKAGRATVAAGCRGAALALKGKLALIPGVGPLVVTFAGGLLDHMNSEQFSNNVYTVVRDAAKATWEGIKQTTGNLLKSKVETFTKVSIST